jgi:hypothetical protein
MAWITSEHVSVSGSCEKADECSGSVKDGVGGLTS